MIIQLNPNINKYKIINIESTCIDRLEEFCNKRNHAYISRTFVKNHRLLNIDELNKLFQSGTVLTCLGLLSEDDSLIGGGLLTEKKINVKKVAYVSSFWAMTECQGQGIGSLILRQLVKIAIDIRESNNLWAMTSEIHSRNIASIRIHKKNGFFPYYVYNNSPGNAYSICFIRPLHSESLTEKLHRNYSYMRSYIISLNERMKR